MTNRLTPEALDVLLAEHQPSFGHTGDPCCNCGMPVPCTIVLLASEVRDAREANLPDEADPFPVAMAAMNWAMADNYTAVQAALQVLRLAVIKWHRALAHYEEGTK